MHEGRTFVHTFHYPCQLVGWLAAPLAELWPFAGIANGTIDEDIIPEFWWYARPVEMTSTATKAHGRGDRVVTHPAAFGAVISLLNICRVSE